MTKSNTLLGDLLSIMSKLRSPEGCPWDKEQTLHTLKPFLLEETYELLEAIDSGIPEQIKEELGDLLLQIVFQAQVAKEAGWFEMKHVIEVITQKLIRRHPHVFGEIQVANSDEVQSNWQQIKRDEGKSFLGSVPRTLPALLRAQKITERAAHVGFDWTSIEPVFDKLNEEQQELRDAIALKDQKNIEEELGDLLFTVVNLARKLNVSAENALNRTIDKFYDRFNFVEQQLGAKGIDLETAGLKTLDQLWNQAKKKV